ncbi:MULTISPECIES: DUF1059 domain-containing protein [unclassified Saccharothrix]|uniref:DUF1059 domain-containing protein n=1 Tax=unclassified Saccharothrix TaxID=2593673 RepID=UPI00307E5992
MSLIINCECGYVVRGETEDELVADAQKHARDVHGMEMTREQALSLATVVEA